ncbi:MAG: NADH-quinone oxidoreductase subunit M [Phycisphaeraceae bacterium]|nr:NADH-quinone oxidoreductase subunit M [Phycisphaeraceae bacterium]
MLLALILIPLLTAAVVPLAPKRSVGQVALLGTLVALALAAYLTLGRDWSGPDAGRDLAVSAPWMPELGLVFKLGTDGLSMSLVALTALLGPICVACSFTAVTQRVRTYYGWLLVLQAAMTGVFLARDMILFYVFFEFTLVPMFVLISLYGSTNRKAAAVKFFLYTFTGSVIALAGIVYAAWFNANRVDAADPVAKALVAASPDLVLGRWTFDLASLQAAASRFMSAETQWWVFLALLCGFAVKVPLVPVHTWLPLAHTEAPTAGSVVLAGVLLKLGTYGLLKIAIGLCPAGAMAWAPTIGLLCLLGIVGAGLICWVQTDVKKLVAYSSVAHLGFCVLGLFAFNDAGVQGSVLYMINHGLSTGALFLCIGMIYERYHTRSMREIGGLAARMPIWATFMVFFTMASVGLPGLNGFVSEFLCLLGAFQAGDVWRSHPLTVGGTGGNLGPYVAAIAGTGMIIAAMYLLYMLGHVVFGPLREPHHDEHHSASGGAHDAEPRLPADLTAREIGVLAPLAVLCLVLGVYPKPLMRMVDPGVKEVIAAVEGARTQRPATRPVAEGDAGAAPALATQEAAR